MLKTFFKYCLPKCVVCSLPLPCLCVCVFLFFFLHCNWSHPKLPTIQQVIFFFQQFMFKHLFLIYALHWLMQLTLMAEVCWQWPSKLLSSVISLFWGNKTTKTKPFDRFVAASSVSLINLYLFFNDECEMFSWMYEKENKWWWSCSVKSDLYIQRELSLAVMMLLPEGLHSSTLTTRGRVIKQSHKEHSEEDVSIIFNELNFWTTVNWTLIVLLLHLFAFVLFVWNHSFFVVLV